MPATPCKETGPDHDKYFVVGVYVKRYFAGRRLGQVKQEAEQAAARRRQEGGSKNRSRDSLLNHKKERVMVTLEQSEPQTPLDSWSSLRRTNGLSNVPVTMAPNLCKAFSANMRSPSHGLRISRRCTWPFYSGAVNRCKWIISSKLSMPSSCRTIYPLVRGEMILQTLGACPKERPLTGARLRFA